VERFENGGDVCGFRSLNNSTSKRVLDLLEPLSSLEGYDRELHTYIHTYIYKENLYSAKNQ